MTLVEVVAAIVILTTLLVSVLVACSRQLKQARLANEKLAAVEELNQLLLQKQAEDFVWKDGMNGELGGEGEHTFEARRMSSLSAASGGLGVLRVLAFDNSRERRYLTHIDLVISEAKP